MRQQNITLKKIAIKCAKYTQKSHKRYKRGPHISRFCANSANFAQSHDCETVTFGKSAKLEQNLYFRYYTSNNKLWIIGGQFVNELISTHVLAAIYMGGISQDVKRLKM